MGALYFFIIPKNLKKWEAAVSSKNENVPNLDCTVNAPNGHNPKT
jgi:hypothetical protein